MLIFIVALILVLCLYKTQSKIGKIVLFLCQGILGAFVVVGLTTLPDYFKPHVAEIPTISTPSVIPSKDVKESNLKICRAFNIINEEACGKVLWSSEVIYAKNFCPSKASLNQKKTRALFNSLTIKESEVASDMARIMYANPQPDTCSNFESDLKFVGLMN